MVKEIWSVLYYDTKESYYFPSVIEFDTREEVDKFEPQLMDGIVKIGIVKIEDQ